MNRNYEAMFIVDPVVASKEWNKVTEEIEKTLKRYGATILSVKKWGERKLAYPIKKQQRGTYVLAYYKAPTSANEKIRADFQLSEIVLRCLILQLDGEVKEAIAPKDFETIGVAGRAPEEAGGEEHRGRRERERTPAPRSPRKPATVQQEPESKEGEA